MLASHHAQPGGVVSNELARDARITGLLYLGLAITGLLWMMLVRPQLFDSDDPAVTLDNLVAHESLARLGIALELGIVITQALAAVWFYRLFRATDTFAAGTLAAFGLINAVVILTSTAFLATALDVAVDSIGEQAANAQTMFLISENLWGVGAIFFGLWLIPMGWLALRSGWMPDALGWVLIVGGVGYIAGGFVHYLADNLAVADLLTIPSTVGEFWMIGFLLLRSLRTADTGKT